MPGARVWSPAAAAALCALLVLTVAFYLANGLGQAYLVADDFQWLGGGKVFSWARVWQTGAGQHFYRPLIEIWFGALVPVCGASTSCYHFANLGVHLVNITLCFCLTAQLAGGVRIPFLAGLLFALVPGHTQAVVWVSALTELSAAMCVLASLVAQAHSWRVTSEAGRRFYDALAVVFLLGALASHEVGAMLPFISIVMWWIFRPGDLRQRRGLLAGLAGGLTVFAVATLVGNWRNPVFTESQYRIGLHGLRNGFEYLVALYVGPGSAAAYALCALGIAVLLAANRLTRFGALFLLLALCPFVWFTAGTASRYLYLPAVGFSIAVAAGLTALVDRIGAGGRRQIWRHATYVVVVAFVAIRFGQFYAESIRSQVAWTQPWRAYASELAARTARTEAGLRIPALPDPDNNQPSIYAEPIVRWMFDDYAAAVVR